MDDPSQPCRFRGAKRVTEHLAVDAAGRSSLTIVLGRLSLDNCEALANFPLKDNLYDLPNAIASMITNKITPGGPDINQLLGRYVKVQSRISGYKHFNRKLVWNVGPGLATSTADNTSPSTISSSSGGRRLLNILAISSSPTGGRKKKAAAQATFTNPTETKPLAGRKLPTTSATPYMERDQILVL